MNIDMINSLLAEDVQNDKNFRHITPNENIISRTAKSLNNSDLAGRYSFGNAYNNEKFTLYHGFTSLAKNGFNEVLSICEHCKETTT
jgi:hypothetical protein